MDSEVSHDQISRALNSEKRTIFTDVYLLDQISARRSYAPEALNNWDESLRMGNAHDETKHENAFTIVQLHRHM